MDEELIALAGEYVLGTLDQAERAAFLRRMASDPAALRAVADWHQRLALLGLLPAEVAPPAYVWPAIEARIDAPATAAVSAAATTGAANDNRVAGWWRGAAVAASVAALLLAGLAVMPGLKPGAGQSAPQIAIAPEPAATPTYVSAVMPTGAEPALLITLDAKTGRAVVRAIGLTPPQKKSLELWYIGGGRDPQSLGLVAGDERMEMMLGDAMKHRDKLDESLFAISVEPEGGAPAGKPTGDIVYTGKVMQVSGS